MGVAGSEEWVFYLLFCDFSDVYFCCCYQSLFYVVLLCLMVSLC